MATRKQPAFEAAQSDAPISAKLTRSADRDGVSYPALRIAGEAPRKGSIIRVQLEGGLAYTGKVHDVTGDGVVETEGLTPVTE